MANCTTDIAWTLRKNTIPMRRVLVGSRRENESLSRTVFPI